MAHIWPLLRCAPRARRIFPKDPGDRYAADGLLKCGGRCDAHHTQTVSHTILTSILTAHPPPTLHTLVLLLHLPGEQSAHPQLGQGGPLSVFALTCTSAASERVFSLVKAMFGKANDRILADGVQGSVMLRYDKRMVR